MEYKPLGKTGVMVPEIGLGTWKYRGGVEPLQRGIALGASLIDTAEIYRTENVVGQAIQGMRERIFLATKVSGEHLRYDAVLRAAEASLRLLGTEVIDLYQIHWPNARVPIKETMQAMETLVERGQVRYIGVSNFSVRELQAAQAVMTRYPIVANQVLYNLNRRDIERDLLPYCQEHDITILAYTPLDDGRLAATSRLRRNAATRVLEQIATEVQRTMAQVALNWCTTRSHVIAIPKSDSVERTVENCQASDWRLTPTQIRQLDDAFR
ncbi:MAG: aldo/keto reductase [Candidatus Tectomicrobia bacterium]|uniref:Aldo/keto reductase n=1 Tax=Tectimicrobiota bacterium TaxID=2528274 RepID=A0A938B3G1_UNCTE|nr:aldo/keto reductase [Candidatus Tectomicrobia bacterium]